MRLITTIAATLIIFAITPAHAERLKDVTDVMGARSNQLVGYGIVVGLNGTGDGKKAEWVFYQNQSPL